MRLLVFDNYDSFTYNLVHLVKKIMDCELEVHRNDEIAMDKVKEFDKIILSPGPGLPVEAGMLLPLIKEYASSKSILGVCLGHQAIAESFGGKLINLDTVYHGIATPVQVVKREIAEVKLSDSRLTPHDSRFTTHASRLTPHVSQDLFKNIPDKFEAGRYHSWIVAEENFPEELAVTARDDNGYIMALQHKKLDVQGVQFHPESVLTPLGEQILRNWLNA